MTVKNSFFILAILVLGLSPIWLPEYPPIIDLPQYAGNLSHMSSILSGAEEWKGMFDLNLFIPYLGFHIPAYILSLIFPMTIAVKLTTALILCALPISTAYVLHRRNLPIYLALLTIPGLYGFSFQWGFMSFLATCPLFILALDRLDIFFQTNQKKDYIWMCGYSIILFFAHLYPFGLFILIYAIRFFLSPRPLRRLLPVIPAMLIALIWFISQQSQGDASTLPETVWSYGWYRFDIFFPDLLGFINVVDVKIAGVIVLISPIIFGKARFARNLISWIPFILVVLAYFLLPHKLMGIVFAFQRMGFLIIPTYLLTLEPVKNNLQKNIFLHKILIVSIAFSAVSIQFFKSWKFSEEAKGLKDIINSMPSKQRLFYLSHIQSSYWYAQPVYLVYGSWYDSEKKGFTGFDFVSFGLPVTSNSQSLQPDQNFRWSFPNFKCEHPYVNSFDYILISNIGQQDPTDFFFSSRDCQFTLVKNSGDWWLYKKNQ